MCIFFLEFISTWMEYYSKCFTGGFAVSEEHTSAVSNEFERLLQNIFYRKPIEILLGTLSELFMLGLYMK